VERGKDRRENGDLATIGLIERRRAQILLRRRLERVSKKEKREGKREKTNMRSLRHLENRRGTTRGEKKGLLERKEWNKSMRGCSKQREKRETRYRGNWGRRVGRGAITVDKKCRVKKR